jgi:uncharacterized membrane protein YgdD (TMEM256/DUF423 family)
MTRSAARINNIDFPLYGGYTVYLDNAHYLRPKFMIMILTVQVAGAFYGLLAVLIGALGAHSLKKSLGPAHLQSFETGVTYQMYHALVLLVLSFNLGFTSSLETYMAYSFIMGTFLFSFSIYGLCLSAAKGRTIRFLGPLTPLGGLLLVAGWGMLLYSFIDGIL